MSVVAFVSVIALVSIMTSLRPVLCALAAATALLGAAGCTSMTSGTAVRAVPGIDDDSKSPVDVDAVLLENARMQAITGGGEDLTVIPSMDGKQPVDIGPLAQTAPAPCRWYFTETQTFGDLEEFHKTTYQDPPRGALISQGAAGYRDPASARRAFDALTAMIDDCGSSSSGSVYVGDWTAAPEAIQTRTGADCGRDYRLKSVVLVEVTFCGYPASVPDIVLTNLLAKVPG